MAVIRLAGFDMIFIAGARPAGACARRDAPLGPKRPPLPIAGGYGRARLRRHFSPCVAAPFGRDGRDVDFLGGTA